MSFGFKHYRKDKLGPQRIKVKIQKYASPSLSVELPTAPNTMFLLRREPLSGTFSATLRFPRRINQNFIIKFEKKIHSILCLPCYRRT